MLERPRKEPLSGGCRADFHTATAIVEVKKRLSALRDLRDGLVQLATWLVKDRKKNGYLLLMDPRLGMQSLQGEIECVKAAMLPDIADRLHLVVVKEGEITEKPGSTSPKVREFLKQCIEASTIDRTPLPRPYKREEVFLVILYQWVSGGGPMTSRWIEDIVGCNYRTVSAAVNQMGPAIQRHSDRRIELKYFPTEDWERFLAVAHRARATMHFADPSDQPRSPESLVRRLGRLGRSDVALGGVFGARQHDPNLDIIGAPRLDLSVHAPGRDVDLTFVKKLDPSLEHVRDMHRPARLALHFVRRKNPLFVGKIEGIPLADPVECLLHLYESRLETQASGFAEYLEMRGRKSSAGS